MRLYDEIIHDILTSLEKQDKQYSLLLVEDNEDLLQLMVRLLSVEYTVYTAKDG